MSNDSFISCIFKRLYWVIEFEINHKGSERDQLGDNTVAYVTTTRMKNQINTETAKENERNDQSENNIEGKNNKSVANADFENTVLNRKLNDISESEMSERKENYDTYTETQNEPSTYNKVMLWHARMGHASLNYLKAMQRKYPHIKNLNQTVFDDGILDCEVCMISKINRLCFNKLDLKRQSPCKLCIRTQWGL